MAHQFQVEDGFPLPTLKSTGAKYPWSDLAVGQSFFVPNPPKFFNTTISAEGRKRGRKFSARSVDGGTRVWRIA